MAIKLIGGLLATLLEVEANTKAARTALRPTDVGALGSYRKAMFSGTIGAGLGTIPIFSFRYGAANLCLVRRVRSGGRGGGGGGEEECGEDAEGFHGEKMNTGLLPLSALVRPARIGGYSPGVQRGHDAAGCASVET